MIIPTPLDATAGDRGSAAAFDLGVRDPLTFLLSTRPRVHAYDNTGVLLTDAADTLLTFDTEVYDNDSMHSTSSNTSRIVFTTAGLYTVRLGVQLPAATYTANNVNGRVNAAGNPAAGTALAPWLSVNPRFIQVSFTRQFSAADYVEFWINQTSGSNRTTTAGSLRTFCQAIFESA